MDRVTDCGDRRIGMARELLRNGTDQRGCNARLVALDVDDDLLRGPTALAATSAMRSVPERAPRASS